MPVRLFRVALAATLAGLLALPACKKKEDGPPGPGLDLPADKELIRQSADNLKQIARAIDNGFACAVHGIYGPDGKTLGLSWRVAILPYIGEEVLYKQFKLDEPWDSPHNKTLIPQMPKVYAPPGKGGAGGQTYYCAFEGKDAFLRPITSPRKPGTPALGLHLHGGVTDGTSNTLMVVEAGEAVVWTKPQDIPFDKDKPLPPLGGIFRKVTNVVLCDGAISYIPRDTPEAVIKALITPGGGEAEAREFFKDQEPSDAFRPRPDRTP